MELDHRLIVFDDQVFHLQLRSLWKNLSKLVECARNECLLATVVTREGVSTHYDPVDIIRNVFEEGCAVAVLESLEDFANVIGGNGQVGFTLGLSARVACSSHLIFSFRLSVRHRRLMKHSALE